MVLCFGLVKTENIIYLVNVLGCVCVFLMEFVYEREENIFFLPKKGYEKKLENGIELEIGT